MKKRDQYKRRRARLHQQYGGRCFWCDAETILPEGASDNNPNGATLDHIKNRTSKKHGNNERNFTVLSCRRCNNIRGKFEEAFYFELDNSLKQTQPHKNRDLIRKLENRVSTALVNYLDKGGEVGGEVVGGAKKKTTNKLIGLAKALKDARINQERQANV